MQPRPRRAHEHDDVAVIIAAAGNQTHDLLSDPDRFPVLLPALVAHHRQTLHSTGIRRKIAAADKRLAWFLVIHISQRRCHQ